MSILIKQLSLETTAPREKVWKIWADVAHWDAWDSEIEYARLDGPFMLGQTGELKPKGGPKAKTKIIAFSSGESYSDVTKMPLANIRFDHRVEDHGKTRIVTHTISMSGPLGFLFAKLLGKNLAEGLQRSLPRLVALAEAHA